MQNKVIFMSPFGMGQNHKVTLGYLGKMSPGHQGWIRISWPGMGADSVYCSSVISQMRKKFVKKQIEKKNGFGNFVKAKTYVR